MANKSGIHIKPSKKGTFTAAAKKHGQGVQSFARQVLANKGNYSPAMVKKANFARNAAKWKHDDGGYISPYTQSTMAGGGMFPMMEPGGYVPNNPGFDALPKKVQNKIIANMNKAAYGADIEPFHYNGYNDTRGNWHDPGLKKRWAAESGMSVDDGYVEMGGVDSMTPLPGHNYPTYDDDIRPLPGNWPTPNEDMRPLPGKARYGAMMMASGGKLPLNVAIPRFRAAGNMDRLDEYYAEGGAQKPPVDSLADYYGGLRDYYTGQGIIPVTPENIAPYAPGMAPASRVAEMQQAMPAAMAAQARAAAPSQALNPYEGPSVYDFLAAQNEAPDYQSRKGLANLLGIEGYRGSADQNQRMIEMVRANPDILLQYEQAASPGGPGRTGVATGSTGKVPGQGNTETEPEGDAFPEVKKVGKVNKEDQVQAKNILEKLTSLIAPVSGLGLAGMAAIEASEVNKLMKAINNGTLNVNARDKVKITEALADLSNKIHTNVATSATEQAKWWKSLSPAVKTALSQVGINEGTGNAFKSSIDELKNLRGTDRIRAIQELGDVAKLEKLGKVDEIAGLAPAMQDWYLTLDPAKKALLDKFDLEAITPQELKGIKNMATKGPIDKLENILSYYGDLMKESEAARKGMSWMQKAGQLAEEYPWLKTAGKFIRRMPKFQAGGVIDFEQAANDPNSPYYDPEPWWLELVDPSGYTSWDDWRRSMANPDEGLFQKTMATAALVPMVGKIGKIGKIAELAKASKTLSAAEKAAIAAKAAEQAAKANKTLSTGKKVWKGAKALGAGAWNLASGAPLVYGGEWLGTKAARAIPLAKDALNARQLFYATKIPKAAAAANFVNDLSRSERFWHTVKTAPSETPKTKKEQLYVEPMEEMVDSIPMGEPIKVLTPDNRIINTHTNDPQFQDWYFSGAIDTARGSKDKATGAWRLKEGANYKKYQAGGTENAMGATGGSPYDPFPSHGTLGNNQDLASWQGVPYPVPQNEPYKKREMATVDRPGKHNLTLEQAAQPSEESAPPWSEDLNLNRKKTFGSKLKDKLSGLERKDIMYGTIAGLSLVDRAMKDRNKRQYQLPEYTPYQNQGASGFGSSAIGNSPIGFAESGGWIGGTNAVGYPYISGIQFGMGGTVAENFGEDKEYDYKAKGGQMIKRKDGSYSRRGLWDNIRANRGSGKKPTAEMLRQERKIKAAEAEAGMGVTNRYYPRGGEIMNVGSLEYPIARSGGHIRMNNDSMYEEGGELELYNGDVKDISKNVLSGPSARFIGPSHAKGGIDMEVNNKPIEAEGGEGFWVDDKGAVSNPGTAHIFGAIKRDNGMTYATTFKELAKEENKSFKKLQKAKEDLGKYDFNNPYERLSWNSAYLKYQGAMQEQAEQAAAKEYLAQEQQQMHDLAAQLGIEPMDLNKLGGKIKAQDGISVTPEAMKRVWDWKAGQGYKPRPLTANFKKYNAAIANTSWDPGKGKTATTGTGGNRGAASGGGNRGQAPAAPTPTTPTAGTPPAEVKKPAEPTETIVTKNKVINYRVPPFKFIKDKFDYTNILPELYTNATNTRIPVYAQGMIPEMEQAYRLSPDIASEQSAYRASVLASGWNPSQVQQAAALKHMQVGAKEAATEAGNIQRYADIVNRNKQSINQAKLANMGIFNQQAQEQRDEMRYKRDVDREVVRSMAEKKLGFEKMEKLRELYEKNMYNYQLNPKTGQMSYTGGAPALYPTRVTYTNPYTGETTTTPTLNPNATAAQAKEKAKAGKKIMKGFKRYNY